MNLQFKTTNRVVFLRNGYVVLIAAAGWADKANLHPVVKEMGGIPNGIVLWDASSW